VADGLRHRLHERHFGAVERLLVQTPDADEHAVAVEAAERREQQVLDAEAE
jgi:hypothetical protein